MSAGVSLEYPTSQTTRISLVRHGHVANSAGVYYGRLPGFALSTVGQAQAVAAGQYLRPQNISAVLHSPMLRAQQTATLIANQLDRAISPQAHEDLNEVLSSFDGATHAQMEQIDWNLYSQVVEPYERPVEVLARVVSFLEWAQAEYRGGHVIGVTHGDLVAFAVAWVSGLAVEPESRQRLDLFGVAGGYPATGSVTTLAFGENIAPDQCSLVYWCPA